MNFESFRVDWLRMTQNELAELLGVTQDKISRYEQGDPDDIPLGFYRKMAEKLDMTLYEILMRTGVKEVERAKVKELAVDYNSAWGKVDRTKKELIRFFDKTINEDISKNAPCLNILKEQCVKMVCSCTRKKRIVVAGRFGVGKTALINALLASDIFSVSSYTANAGIRFIRHIDDRPTSMGNNTVFIYKPNDNNPPASIYDNMSDLIGEQGNYDLLSKNERQNKSASLSDNAAAVAVYLDCNILKNIDIIELPDFCFRNSLVNAMSIISGADALIYLHSECFDDDEIAYLQNAIKALPSFEYKGKNDISPLGNLFIVLSHADRYTDEQLDAIINKSIECFSDSLPVDFKEYFTDRSNATGYDIEKKEFSGRFFKYSTVNPTMREPFEKNLADFIYNISALTLSNTNLFLTQFIDFSTREADRYSSEENETEQLKKLDEAKARISVAISEYSHKAEEDFSMTYASIINEKHIIQVIKSKELKKRKTDIKRLANLLSAELEISLCDNLNHYSNLLQLNIDAYLADFNFLSLRGLDRLSKNATLSGRLSFASDFPAFVLRFCKIAFLLPRILYPWLKVFDFISEILIPNSGWQKEIAKSIIAAYNAKNIKELIHEDIQNFWKKVSETVDKAIESMKNSLQEREESIIKLSSDTQDSKQQLALTRKNLSETLSSGIKAIFSESQ